MVYLGFEPGTAGRGTQTNPLSMAGPNKILFEIVL